MMARTFGSRRQFVQAADQFKHQFERERVAALGPVESDDSELAFNGSDEVLVGHVDAPTCSVPAIQMAFGGERSIVRSDCRAGFDMQDSPVSGIAQEFDDLRRLALLFAHRLAVHFEK